MRNIQLPPPSASDLMLDILSGYGPQGLSVQALCKAGRVMDIAETNVRVALNRLTNQSKIFSPRAGFMRLIMRATLYMKMLRIGGRAKT